MRGSTDRKMAEHLRRDPIERLRSSPYRGTAPVLGAHSGRSLPFFHTFFLGERAWAPLLPKE
ncbi:hypothetical protein ASE76_02810 [Xylophilus sp. Leaf220]|nr:hypothetical protein ASE76_02810 [Xylophilus sp. Leaf220]